jgi:DNA-binding NtrC family response regulator
MTASAPTREDRPLLLIVDDDPLITDTLGYVLGRDFEVITSPSRSECIRQLRELPRLPQLALVDLGLPPTPHRPDEGFLLVSDLLAHAPPIRIVILSGQSEEAHARHARALGAAEFIGKPADPERLRHTLLDLLSFTRETSADLRSPGGLLGDSPPMKKLRAQVRQYAESPFPVLIEGESGTGKDIIASHCLHRLTSRSQLPFLALNCAAISPTLVEPTLFGYAKGAFTGATAAKAGYFEDAGHGTLFLDEIGELPGDLQPKLLRVLENGEYQRVGETRVRLANCRVVAATNRDLRRETKAGHFRTDLYHRLSVFTIVAPPLREMGDDRVLLLEHFRRLYAAQSGQAAFELDAQAIAIWREYRFPGNVRELRNIVIRLGAKHGVATVGARELAAELDFYEEAEEPPAAIPPRNAEELAELATRHLQNARSFALDATLRLWEKAYVEAAMQLAHGNVSQAARLLGIHRTTLYNRLDALARNETVPGRAGDAS